jgi:hypothetical protein
MNAAVPRCVLSDADVPCHSFAVRERTSWARDERVTTIEANFLITKVSKKTPLEKYYY